MSGSGLQGPAGPRGAFWFTGASPQVSQGQPGDMFLDAKGNVWQKQAGGFGIPSFWQQAFSIVGPPGTKGTPGAIALGATSVALGVQSAPVMLGFIYGLQLSYATSTAITVGQAIGMNLNGVCGVATDSTGVELMTLAQPATVTVDGHYGTGPGLTPNTGDGFTGPGTVSTSGTSVTGTSTTFLTSFGTRVLTGTCSSSITVVTGTGTLFLTQIAVGDLIGNPTAGYARVVSIQSNTTLFLSAAPPNAAFSTSAVNCIEAPMFYTSVAGSSAVDSISSNTALGVVASQGTQSGVAYAIGCWLTPANSGQQPFIYIWLGTGVNGITVFASTQYTTPFGIPGHNSYFRRIGTILLYNGAVQYFTQTGLDNERRMDLWLAEVNSAPATRLLSGGAATTWTTIQCNTLAPRSAQFLQFTAVTSASLQLFLRATGGAGSVAATSNLYGYSSAGGVSTPTSCPCNGAQQIDYVLNAADPDAYLDFQGFIEFV
jgi:hypothetical protein